MSTSISIKELKELDPSSYQIVDIRDAVEISHGAIPGALVMKTEEIETNDAIDRSKKTIICCSRGRFSVAAAEELQEKGWDAVSLEGGYIAWLMDVMSAPEEQDKAADVEKSLPCGKFPVLSLRENAPRPSVSFCTAARLQQDCTRPSLR